jgi:hypothetical protein
MSTVVHATRFRILTGLSIIEDRIKIRNMQRRHSQVKSEEE